MASCNTCVALCARQRTFWPFLQNLAMEAQRLIVQFCLLERKNAAEVMMDRTFIIKAVFFHDPEYLNDIKILENLDDDGEYGVHSQHNMIDFLKHAFD